MVLAVVQIGIVMWALRSYNAGTAAFCAEAAMLVHASIEKYIKLLVKACKGWIAWLVQRAMPSVFDDISKVCQTSFDLGLACCAAELHHVMELLAVCCKGSGCLHF